MKFIFKIIYPLFCSVYVSCLNNSTQFQLAELPQLYFIENESYYLDQSKFQIPFQDKEDLSRKLENLSSIKLIEKQKEFNLGFVDNSTLLTLLRHQQKYIDICALHNEIIDCKLRINNTLYNDDIIVNEITSNNSINLPSKDCYNAFVIEDESFLIHCHNSINQIQYFIINNKSQILDEITIDQSLDCRFQSKFQFNKIFIYSIDCEVSILILIETINKDSKVQFNHNFIKLHEQDNYPKQTNLIDLKICESNQIFLIYNNSMLLFNLNNNRTITFNYQYKRWLGYLEESCFPYVLKGQFSTKHNIDQNNLLLEKKLMKESLLKRIQYFENIFIFQYENEANLLYDAILNQQISNVKQINQLNKLSFLVTLDKNNNISIYKLICLTKIIKYQNFPYTAIFQKSLYGFQNNIVLLYCQTSFYSIELPFQIPQLANIQITQDFLHKNSFRVNKSQLNQIIPTYFDLIQDLDHIFNEQNNEAILTYHKKLPIKKILKIISDEMNFFVIIYEDQNHKIFVHIKGDNFQRNFNVMNTTNEISVESFKVGLDSIIILFIKINQITTYMISDKKDLIYKDTIMSKIKIKECKADLNEIICLFYDNTIGIYSTNIWSEYFQTQKKDLQDFWFKVKENKFEDFRVPYLYINYENNYVEIKPLKPQLNNILITVTGQILYSHIFVLQNRLLLIVQNEDLIQLQNYYFEINQINFLYKMSTYEFRILYPLKIKFYSKLFCIITTKNGQDYLFIYDITQQARSCLRQIIKMYPNYNDFDLIDETGILSLHFPDKIIISYPFIIISINSLKKSDLSIIESEIQFQAKSYIESIPSFFSINFQLPNIDNNLRYKFNAEQQQRLFVNSQNEITNIDSIYGSINSLNLSNWCNGFIQLPIKVLKTQQLSCSQIIQKFCLIDQKILIYDFFDSNGTILLPVNQKILNNFNSFYQIIPIIYNDFSGQIAFVNILNNQSIEQSINETKFYEGVNVSFIHYKFQSINTDNSLIILYSDNMVQIYSLIGNEKNLSYQLDCQIHFEQMIQIEYLFYDDSQYFFLLLISESTMILISCHKNMFDLNKSVKFDPFFQIVAFHILDFEIFNSEIHLNVILFCLKDIGYIFQINFDFREYKIQKQSIKQLIRYLNVTFEKFQKLTETIYILKGISDKSISSSFLYNINRNQTIVDELVDYFYKYEQAQDIQRYNETHFILQEKRDLGIVVQLIQINYYKVIFVQKQCNLVLNNDVSRLTTIIIRQENILTQSQITLYLVIVDFILIILFNRNKQKNRAACCQRS